MPDEAGKLLCFCAFDIDKRVKALKAALQLRRRRRCRAGPDDAIFHMADRSFCFGGSPAHRLFTMSLLLHTAFENATGRNP
jgi:hypothetical protein